MRFSLSSAELLKKLQIVSGAIAPNPVLPVLEDFLFSLSENVLTIKSSNLETTIITKIDVISEEDGVVAVPARILLDTLKALPDQPITFSIDEGFAIELKSDYGKYNLAGDNPDDFPETPLEEDIKKVELKADDLVTAINRTIFATSVDELRLAMTGVYLQVDFNKLIFVATDAHKLVKYSYADNISSDTTSSIIIPKKALSLVRNIWSGDDIVSISYNNKNVFLASGDVRLVCRLIDAKYPDYNAVIPVENPNTLFLNRKDFQNSLKRISIYSNKTTNQVVLNISEKSLTISAQDLDFSNEATEQLSCQYDGENMTIGFNAKFLVEMLNVIETDEIKLELSTPNKAGILRPSEQDEHENLLMLVMPVMMGY